jgi:hypothetical protein
MDKITVSEPDGWDLSVWKPEDIVVEDFTLAIRSCGDDLEQVVVITDEGRELRVLGIRPSPGRPVVEIVVREVSR